MKPAIVLDVPYMERQQCSERGGHWDEFLKKWVVYPGIPLASFRKWMVKRAEEEPYRCHHRCIDKKDCAHDCCKKTIGLLPLDQAQQEAEEEWEYINENDVVASEDEDGEDFESSESEESESDDSDQESSEESLISSSEEESEDEDAEEENVWERKRKADVIADDICPDFLESGGCRKRFCPHEHYYPKKH